MHLPKHAFAVWRGMEMFPKPYPLHLEERREFMLNGGDAFRDALADLTYDVDDGAMGPR
jgi:hypothetical protein